MEIRRKEKNYSVYYIFKMRKKFKKVWFTAIRKTNYKYMYNDRYSHFVPIPSLRRSNSGVVLLKVRIPTSSGKVRIATLRRTIPELYTFLLCAEHIHADIQEMPQYALLYFEKIYNYIYCHVNS